MTEDQMNPLEPDQTIEKALPDRESHNYTVALDTGDFVAVGVEQKGIDVVVRLFAPDGELLTEVDSPTGTEGVERVSGIAQTAGDHRVEVEAFAGGEDDGTYAISVEALRPATDEDRTRVAAERAFTRGEELRRAAQPADALPEYQQALEGWRALGDRKGEADALYRIGWMHELLEEYREAAESCQHALELYQELGDRIAEGSASNRLGQILLLLGQIEAAGQSYGHALELFAELDDRDGQAVAQNGMGNVYKWRGQTEKALAAYERALALWNESDSPDWVTAQFNIGDVYLSNQDLDLALSSLERALDGARATKDRHSEATCLVKMGEALAGLEQFDEALTHLEGGLAIWRETEKSRYQAIAQTSLGTVRLKTGDLPGAKQSFEEALRLFVAGHDPVGQALAHQKLGRYQFASGNLESAQREHEKALSLFQEAGDRQGAASALYGIARARYAVEDYEGARRALEEVLKSAESLRASSASLELRSSYLASRRHYWDLYVRALMRLHDQDPSSHFDLIALQASERWRARGLLDLLAEAGVQIRDGAPAELLEREHQIGVELDMLARQRLQTPHEVTGGTYLKHLSDRETELLLELDRTRAKIRNQSARFVALTDPDPLNIAAIQRDLLDADTLMLVYFLGEDRSFLWDVSRKRIRSHVLPSRAEIEEAASTYYELLTRRSSRAAEQRLEVGRRLGQMLLGPVAEELGTDRLVVVADGALHYLPFTTLPPPQAVAETSDELLIDRHEIVHLPSASVLASLRRSGNGRTRASNTIAVIADPVFELNDPRIGQDLGGHEGAASLSEAGSPLARALRDSGSGSLRRLPHSEEEAHAILALAKEGSQLSALGFEASYNLVEKDALADYRILHFATHGLIDRKHPELSGLALSLYDRHGTPQRGFLRLHEIYNLRLRAQLVVLSACETGLGKELEGEGLVGLTQGFLYAGAPRVVHSLWKVGDASTAELMRRFYTHLLQEDSTESPTPGQALREAQLSMRRESDWSEPAQWAGFVLQGEWRATEHALGDDDIEEADRGGVSTPDGTKPGEDLPPPEQNVPPPPPTGASISAATTQPRIEARRSLMPDAELILNGVRPNGNYAYPHPNDAEVARWFEPSRLQAKSSLRGPGRFADAGDLSEVGWAVVYPAGEKTRFEPLLRDLLDLRRDQAGDYYQEIVLYPNESCDHFLERFGANTGIADPLRLPYYLLLVGNPEQIPFDFQGRLDQTYAVGRLCFDQDEHYRAYARSVVDVESDPPWKPRRRLTLFGALNGEDPATRRTTSGLVEPLSDRLEKSLARLPGWQVDRIVGPSATRETLAELLTGGETPDLLFTAGHGMVFDREDPRQRDLQGALLCSDWQGPGHLTERETYLAAEDLRIDGRPLLGSVTFHLACHSGGTPEWDSFHPPGTGGRKQLTQKPFVAALPKRLLAEAGALAVIAHADRAWTTSFDWAPQDEEPDPRVFQDTVLALLHGYRVGDATERLGELYGQLAAHVTERRNQELQLAPTRVRTDPSRTARLWRASNDIRSFVVLGDPAVKVGGVTE